MNASFKDNYRGSLEVLAAGVELQPTPLACSQSRPIAVLLYNCCALHTYMFGLHYN